MSYELITDSTAELIHEQASVERLTEVRQEVHVFESAHQGPPGPPGPAGTTLFLGQTAQAVGGHRALRLTPSGLDYASTDDLAHAGRVVGISTGAAGAGETVGYQAAGKLTEPSWAWVPGADIWLGADGLLTQTLPSGAAFMQRLGYAVDTASMWVELSEPIIFE